MRRLAIVVLALASACGPGRAANVGEAGEESDSSDSATTVVTTSETGTSDGTGPTTTGTTTDGTDTDDCDTFVCEDLPPPACDPGLQDCPEGQKCTAYLMTPGYCCVDANKCVPIIGDKQHDEQCTRGEDNDDCAEGLFCYPGTTSGDTGPGVCMSFCDIHDASSCDGINEWCGETSDCIAYNDGIMPLCNERVCDPEAQDCTTPLVCMYDSNDPLYFKCRLPPQPGTLTKEGEDCAYVGHCEPGLTCAGATVLEGCDAEACCTSFCDLDEGGANNPKCTATGEECVAYFQQGQVPACYEQLGICALP
jgi:hypothetical protein